MILHLTTRAAWEAAVQQGAYTPPSLEREGFIHCSTAEQLPKITAAFYRDLQEPVVLRIDPDRLQAELRWEPADPSDRFAGESFPHIYGPLNLDAVVEVV